MIDRATCLKVIDVYWAVGRDMLKEFGGCDKCGDSCSRMCCGLQNATKEFIICPLWPGDVEDMRLGVSHLTGPSMKDQSSVIDDVLKLAKEDPHACPLWDRDKKLCRIYDYRPVICRVFGLPFGLWDMHEIGHVQPACPENPLPGEEVKPWGSSWQVSTSMQPSTRALGRILEEGLTIGSRVPKSWIKLVVDAVLDEKKYRESVPVK